jgi:hypothetical protein
MKTKKAKEVLQYERENKKIDIAMQNMAKLQDTPEVKDYIGKISGSEKPSEKVQERRKLLHDAHEEIYHAIRKLNFLEYAIVAEDVRSEMGDDESMGLHLLMTETAKQLEKANDKVWQAYQEKEEVKKAA